nr:hypothetical protein Iba_chr12cCG14280 [Ipomoea batatas]GMD68567.1 hypothetical protein Iba_chr12dCG10420 [Ipomoea batatas]
MSTLPFKLMLLFNSLSAANIWIFSWRTSLQCFKTTGLPIHLLVLQSRLLSWQ